MMNAVGVVFVTMLLIPSSHCQPQVTSSALQGALEAVQFLSTSSVAKRHAFLHFNTKVKAFGQGNPTKNKSDSHLPCSITPYIHSNY